MLYRLDKYLAAIVVSLNFFMIGIEESSLYTILPKYLKNHSENVNYNVSASSFQTNVSQGCYVNKPQYVIVSMVFLAKSLGQLVANLAIGGIMDRVNNYLILAISHVLGIIISLIYAFSNSVLLYIVGRILDAFLASAIFIAIYSIISKLFANPNIRGRYFGVANVFFFVSHSIGPVYGAEIDDKLGKTLVFVLLVPMWCLCSLLTFFLYWRVRNIEKNERQLMRKKVENHSIKTTTLDSRKTANPMPETNENEIEVEFVKKDNIIEDSMGDVNNTEASNVMKVEKKISIFKMLKDRNIMACLFQILLINLSIFSLPPTLPSWMAYQLCSSEVQQGIVWTFGFLGYIIGVMLVVLIIIYAPKLHLYVPICGQIIVGSLLIVLPFSRDWRLIFIPIIGLYFSVGVVEQVIIPLTTALADSRFQSNYGAVNSLTSQSLTFSGIVGTLLSGYISEKFGFISLAIFLGVMNLVTSPISLIHRSIKS